MQSSIHYLIRNTGPPAVSIHFSILLANVLRAQASQPPLREVSILLSVGECRTTLRTCQLNEPHVPTYVHVS
jgi:hypothetical protein